MPDLWGTRLAFHVSLASMQPLSCSEVQWQRQDLSGRDTSAASMSTARPSAVFLSRLVDMALVVRIAPNTLLLKNTCTYCDSSQFAI